MARKRIVDAPALKSWEDVDKALREIAEKEIALADIDGDMNKQINGIKTIAAQEAKPHQDRIDKLSKDIKEFVEEHKAELGNKKTMTLNFGQCGFRQSTTISLPKAKEKINEIIRKLKARKMGDCIVATEKVDKDMLRKYGEDTVNAIGATWKQKDVFWYEAAKEKLEKLQGS
ncbi:MAG: host-nuclease inhibitor Gam family protein [Hungatella sp.]|jgi:phage host-nuclease inhibitor protein Gam|nr:host-nuclease inhibitor Gam family protein [Hungatella sp.]